jgi:predicted short-subunit dehydrogenase-like oxidoreductase (DUF2520 family)
VVLPSVGIVGTGALARALGRALCDADVAIAAVASGDLARAAAAAAFIGPTVKAVGLAALPALAHHVVVATADTRIEDTARALADAGMRSGVALHTSGAMGLRVLAPLSAAGISCGVFHPLQTFADNALSPLDLFRDITVAAAGDPQAVAWARDLAARLGARTVTIDAEHFAAYHAGAVLASNAVAALLDSAVTMFGRAGVAPDAALAALGPLTRTAVDNALRLGPRAALTGPVVRGDVLTVRHHLAETSAFPHVDALYRAASRCLVELASARGLAPEQRLALTEALDVQAGRKTI